MRREVRMVVLVVVVGLLAAGCGVLGSDDESSTPSPDEQALRGALLVIGDVPRGWIGTPPEESGGDGITTDEVLTDEQLATNPACASLAALDQSAAAAENGTAPAKVEGLTLSTPDDSLSVQETLETAPSPEQAAQLAQLFAAPEAAPCFQSLFQSLATPAELGIDDPALTVTVTAAALPASATGATTGGIRVTMNLSSPLRGTVDVYLDMVVLAKGRVVAHLLFLGAGSPFPADLAGQLQQTAADRMPAL